MEHGKTPPDGRLDEPDTLERQPQQPTTRELLQRTQETRARIGRAAIGPRSGAPRLPDRRLDVLPVALLNGIAWGLIVPLFQTPDEPGHVAYVQHVAETGKPPTGGAGSSTSRRRSASCST